MRVVGCRLVYFCGCDFVRGIDIPTAEIHFEIRGAIEEGFSVDWQENDSRIYLCVWEPPNMEIQWPQVFAERDFEM